MEPSLPLQLPFELFSEEAQHGLSWLIFLIGTPSNSIGGGVPSMSKLSPPPSSESSSHSHPIHAHWHQPQSGDRITGSQKEVETPGIRNEIYPLLPWEHVSSSNSQIQGAGDIIVTPPHACENCCSKCATQDGYFPKMHVEMLYALFQWLTLHFNPPNCILKWYQSRDSSTIRQSMVAASGGRCYGVEVRFWRIELCVPHNLLPCTPLNSPTILMYSGGCCPVTSVEVRNKLPVCPASVHGIRKCQPCMRVAWGIQDWVLWGEITISILIYHSFILFPFFNMFPTSFSLPNFQKKDEYFQRNFVSKYVLECTFYADLNAYLIHMNAGTMDLWVSACRSNMNWTDSPILNDAICGDV